MPVEPAQALRCQTTRGYVDRACTRADARRRRGSPNGAPRHIHHPHGLADRDFDTIFTRDKPIIFAYHGYPWLIHRLTYRRTNHGNLHVRGYKEEGTTTTPFDMAVLNDIDRFHLVADVIDRVPKLGPVAAYAKQMIRDKLIEHEQYIHRHGEDLPEVRHWKWGGADD